MDQNRICSDCSSVFPLTRDYFGQVKSANGNNYWRGICRLCMRLRAAKHHKENPTFKTERSRRRNLAERELVGFHTDSDIDAIRKRLVDKCRYCSKPLKNGGELDHMTPVTRDGTNWPDNLTLACGACNRNKGNRTVEEYGAYLLERGLKMRRLRN